MKDLNRNVPAVPVPRGLESHNEFCVCRVLADCALIKIGSLAKLPLARKYMRHVASQAPGSYVVFSYRSKRVLGKVVSHAVA
jgi:hypothetical protein